MIFVREGRQGAGLKRTAFSASTFAALFFEQRQMIGKDGQLKKLEGRPVSDSALLRNQHSSGSNGYTLATHIVIF